MNVTIKVFPKNIVIYNKNVTELILRTKEIINLFTVINLELAKNIENYSNWQCAARKTIHCKWNKTHLFSFNAVRNYFETLCNPLKCIFKLLSKNISIWFQNFRSYSITGDDQDPGTYWPIWILILIIFYFTLNLSFKKVVLQERQYFN